MSDVSLQPILVLLSQSAGGNPSQYMVEKSFERHQLDWRYLTVEVAAEAIGDAVRGIRAMGFLGGNCARPHNRLAGRFLDRLGPVAERSGSVNVILRDEGRLVGENTEGKGMLKSIEACRGAPPQRVLLFGAGDLARAAACELADAGVELIVVVNRDATRAQALCEMLGERPGLSARVSPWEESIQLPEGFDVLINATPVGSQPDNGRLPFDWESLATGATAVDANLQDTRPRLLVEASERGLSLVNGLDIFLEQAVLNFRLWTGLEPERTVMRESVEEFLEL
ncbi:MAG: shikimate dehydrogenase [Pirellulaceae bacterium]|nr:shikimate dehydrogenase [Thermoguttaceae bacterium]MDI9443825.1 shikimate dehydrogenase [Planctomycetota bacterium]NLZ01460.1 shikimate dehydrogenase [Pirellulaceae bacterium]